MGEIKQGRRLTGHKQLNNCVHPPDVANSERDRSGIESESQWGQMDGNKSSSSRMTGDKGHDHSSQTRQSSVVDVSNSSQAHPVQVLKDCKSPLRAAPKLSHPTFLPFAVSGHHKALDMQMIETFSKFIDEAGATSERDVPASWLNGACAQAQSEPSFTAVPTILSKLLEDALNDEILTDMSRRSCQWLLQALELWSRDLQKLMPNTCERVTSPAKQEMLTELIAGLQNVMQLLQTRLHKTAPHCPPAHDNNLTNPFHSNDDSTGKFSGQSAIVRAGDAAAEHAANKVCECLEALMLPDPLPTGLASASHTPSPKNSCHIKAPLTTPLFSANKANISQETKSRSMRHRRLMTKCLLRPRSANKSLVPADWSSSNSPKNNFFLSTTCTAQAIDSFSKAANSNAAYPLDALECAFSADGVQSELQQAACQAGRLFLQSALHPIHKDQTIEDKWLPVLVLTFSYVDTD
jgi:hypothetical protein